MSKSVTGHPTAQVGSLKMVVGIFIDSKTIAHFSCYFWLGVYTATGPDSPMHYATDSCVILCRALLGHTVGTHAYEQGDSWRPRPTWAVFRQPSQLLPMYVVHIDELSDPIAFDRLTQRRLQIPQKKRSYQQTRTTKWQRRRLPGVTTKS